MNVCLKRCVFNLDLNKESVSERYQEGYSRVWEPNLKKFYKDVYNTLYIK